MTFIPDCNVSLLQQFVQQTCPEVLGALLGTAFQFKRPLATNQFTTTGGTPNPITATASWDAFATATDNTTIVYSPFLKDAAIPGSEGNFTGGNDNTTIKGIREYNGENNIDGIPFVVDYPNNTTRQTLKQFTQSSVGATNIQMYFFFESGIYAKNTGVAGTYTGVDIYNFRIPSLDVPGFNQRNKIMGSFDMTADWSDGCELIKNSDLDFTPEDKLFVYA